MQNHDGLFSIKKINSTTLIESRTYKRTEDFTYKEHNVILLCIPFE